MQQLIQQQLITPISPSQLQQLIQQQSLLYQQQVSPRSLLSSLSPTAQNNHLFVSQQHHQLAEISRKQLEQTLQNLQEQLQVRVS
jgi:hypothetical protein